MIKPLSGQVLLRILTPPESQGGIVFANHTLSAEEVQERNHTPSPPPLLTAQVVAIGPWPRLQNGLALMPDFPPGSKVIIRPGTGTDLRYGTNEKLKLVKSGDILAVLEEST